MAHRAHLDVLAPQARGVEPRPVWVVAPAAHSRVAWEAIALGVTADARFETLPRCPAMPRAEESIPVMITRSQRAVGDQPRLLMTRSAEAALTVAVIARRLARVRRRRMARHEAGGVIAGRIGRRRPMALEAIAADVTAGAAHGSRGGGRGVPVGEVGSMRHRRTQCHERGRTRVGRQRCDYARRRAAGMALVAELLSMTRGAGRRHAAAGYRAVSVPGRPTRVVM